MAAHLTERVYLGCRVWNVMDAVSRFLLAPHVSKSRTVEDTEVLSFKAQECPTTHMQQYRRRYRWVLPDWFSA